MPIPEMARPLPKFDQWLTDHGRGKRGDGFEGFADLMERTQSQEVADALTPAEVSLMRMWQGLTFAVVELCQIECDHGRQPVEIIALMPRALACAAFYSTASVLKDDTPWRSIAKLLAEEFRAAAKTCADQQTERDERKVRA